MQKILYFIFSILISVLIFCVIYLSTVGIETSRFNNFIVKFMKRFSHFDSIVSERAFFMSINYHVFCYFDSFGVQKPSWYVISVLWLSFFASKYIILWLPYTHALFRHYCNHPFYEGLHNTYISIIKYLLYFDWWSNI